MTVTNSGVRRILVGWTQRLLLLLAAMLALPASAASEYLVWSGSLTNWPSTGASAVLADVSVAYNTAQYGPSTCHGPGRPDYEYGTPGTLDYVSNFQVSTHWNDTNGTAYDLPVAYTNCYDSWGRPIGDGNYHTGSRTWVVVVCRSGFSAGRYYPSSRLSCLPDAAATPAADASNDQGTHINCDSCLTALVREVSRHDGSNPMVEGDPVNLANGNELFAEEDYTPAGSSLVAFTRYYNSGVPAGTSFFGPGWSHSFRYQALVGDSTGSSVVLVRPDGASVLFTYDATQSKYIAPARETGRLSRVLSGGQLSSLTYTRADGTQEQYTGYNSNCFGCLTSIVYGQGGQLTATLSGTMLSNLADNRGHALQFTYQSINGAVRITKVTLPGGAYITYGYTAQGVLASVTYPDGAQKTYEYTGTSARPLLTKVLEGTTAAVTITYDSAGRATSTKLGTAAELTTFTYNSGSTTVTRSLGYSKTVSFDAPVNAARAQAQVVQFSCPDQGCAPKQDSFGYDSGGNLAFIVDANNVKTCLVFDVVRSLPLKTVEGLSSGADCGTALASPPAGSRTRTWQWHALFPVPMVLTAPQRKVLFNYDSAGRKLVQSEVETSDVSGALGASAQGVGTARTTNWTYNSQGSVLSVKSPRTDVNATTTLGYDGNQNLVSITSPVGLVTTLGNYDAHGRPGLITYPNGLQSSLSYDARGRTTQITTGGAVTSYGYNGAGLLVSATLPSGLTLTFSHDDAHRLIAVQDSLGNRVDRVLDTEGNVLQETVTGNGGAVALARQAAYDQLSRMTSLMQAP